MDIYVGFDCDECLAQVTQLMPFTEAGSSQKIYQRFAELLLEHDIPFIRPTFWPVLRDISRTDRVRPFIYSNNGSLPTLQFINMMASMRMGKPNFFQAVAHYDNKNRSDNTRGQYVKKWPSVKQFLEKEFALETPIEPRQVMFFDDLPHKPLAIVLGKNYVQVAEFELPCLIDGHVYNVDNEQLLELWKEAGGDPALVSVDDSVGAGELKADEAASFQKRFHSFTESAGWQLGGARRNKRRKYSHTKKHRHY